MPRGLDKERHPNKAFTGEGKEKSTVKCLVLLGGTRSGKSTLRTTHGITSLLSILPKFGRSAHTISKQSSTRIGVVPLRARVCMYSFQERRKKNRWFQGSLELDTRLYCGSFGFSKEAVWASEFLAQSCALDHSSIFFFLLSETARARGG